MRPGQRQSPLMQGRRLYYPPLQPAQYDEAWQPRRLCRLTESALGPRRRPRVEIRRAFSFSQQRMLTVLHANQHSAGVWLAIGRCNRRQKK